MNQNRKVQWKWKVCFGGAVVFLFFLFCVVCIESNIYTYSEMCFALRFALCSFWM